MKRTYLLARIFFTCALISIGLCTQAQTSLTEELTDYDLSKRLLQRKGVTDTAQTILMKSNFRLQPTALADPISIGVTYVALQSVMKDLDALIKSTTGDIAAHLTNLLATGNAVAAHWEHRLSDRLERTIDQLNKTERRIVEDTEALIRMTQQTIRQVEVGAMEVARVTAGEADILAYNITSIIHRWKVPRLVYTQPKKIRVGLNEALVNIRGNFLAYKPYHFTLTEYDKNVEPLAVSANEVNVKLPDKFLESIQQETTVSLSAEMYARKKRLLWFGYRYRKERAQSQTITLKPRISYSIAVSITPKAKLPTDHTFTFNFYDIDENCKADRRVDRLYVLPPGWTLRNFTQAPDISINTANCGSGLIGRGAWNSADNAVMVEAKIKGCGVNWVFNCKGRGWLGYTLRVPAKSYQYQSLPAYEQTLSIANQEQRTFTFDYPMENVPVDNQGVEYTYTLKVVVQEGATSRTVEISDVNPNVEGFRTRMTDNRLSLEIDPLEKIVEVSLR